MFGYIRVCKGELKVKEFEMYKAVYCSLCRDLGRDFGILSRFTLSYDFTFLALLNMAFSEGCDEIERKRCAFNPLKKCNYCKSDASFKMASASAMIMLYYKLKDNVADEKGFKKLGYRLLLPLFWGAHKKAAKKYPEIEKIVSDYIENQSRLEKENCADIDLAADPTATALADIFKLCSQDEMQKRVLARLGYCVGRYIYLLDAACDFEKDRKNSSYNVLLKNVKGDTESFIKERVVPQLYFCANEAALAFELLELKKYKTILGNIIYLGLEETFKKELEI